MNTIRTSLAVTMIVAAFAVGGFTVVHAVLYDPQIEVPLSASSTMPAIDPRDYSDNYPARLIIPTLHIDAAVQNAGIIAGNRMAAPTSFSDVAWYKYGTIPGARGSAVVAGHLNNGLGLWGVFAHLSDLQAGDDVYIKTKGGKTLRFVVQTIANYSYDQVPIELFTNADTARLNLITCDGHWINVRNMGWTYDHRLVAYTILK